MSIEAMKQALEALECIPASGSMLGVVAEQKRVEAITVLRQALKQMNTPVFEPQPQEFVCSTGLCHYKTAAQREWVGLTDEQMLVLLSRIDEHAVRLPKGLRDFARAIEQAHGIGEKK
jgi:hypothetical protein